MDSTHSISTVDIYENNFDCSRHISLIIMHVNKTILVGRNYSNNMRQTSLKGKQADRAGGPGQ